MINSTMKQAEYYGRGLNSRRRRFLRHMVRERGALLALSFLLIVMCGALLAPWIAPFEPYGIDLQQRLEPPCVMNWLGTDEQGRDIFSRILFGIRLTLLTGFLGTFCGGMIGIPIGIIAAFYRRSEGPLMRLMDVLLSFPSILLGLAIGGVAGPGTRTVIAAVSVATIAPTARIARSSATTVVHQDYVMSGFAAGLSEPMLIWRYVFRNCVSPIVVYMTLRLGQVILLGSSLSFLGLGAPPPTAELGTMASMGREFLFFAPHVALIPTFVIFAIVLAFNLFGDSLRDILDPRLQT